MQPEALSCTGRSGHGQPSSHEGTRLWHNSVGRVLWQGFPLLPPAPQSIHHPARKQMVLRSLALPRTVMATFIEHLPESWGLKLRRPGQQQHGWPRVRTRDRAWSLGRAWRAARGLKFSFSVSLTVVPAPSLAPFAFSLSSTPSRTLNNPFRADGGPSPSVTALSPPIRVN